MKYKYIGKQKVARQILPGEIVEITGTNADLLLPTDWRGHRQNWEKYYEVVPEVIKKVVKKVKKVETKDDLKIEDTKIEVKENGNK